MEKMYSTKACRKDPRNISPEGKFKKSQGNGSQRNQQICRMQIQGPVAVDKLEYFDIPPHTQREKVNQIWQRKCSVFKLNNHISNVCKSLPLCYSPLPPAPQFSSSDPPSWDPR